MQKVEQYFADQPDHVRQRLEEFRTIIRGGLPKTTEDLKWGDLAFIHEDGMIVAAYKKHCNVVVTPSALDQMRSEFKDFETGKGSVKIPYDTDIPKQLILDLVQRRLREYEEDGVKWM